MEQRLTRIIEALTYFNLGVCLSVLFPAPQWWSVASGSLALVLFVAGLVIVRRRRRPGVKILRKFSASKKEEGGRPT